jgi:hypothetical protein
VAAAQSPTGRVTQRLDPATLPHLLDDPPRAALAFASSDGPVCVPVMVERDGNGLVVGIDPAALPGPDPPESQLPCWGSGVVPTWSRPARW